MPKIRDERFRAFADTVPVPLRLLTPAGRAVWFNDAWLSFAGRPAQELAGDGWGASLHPDDFARVLEAMSTAAAARQPFSLGYRFRRTDGTYRWVTEAATPAGGPTGTATGYVCSLTDITETRVAEARLAAAEDDKGRFLAAAAYELHARLVPAADGVDLLDGSLPRARRRRVHATIRQQIEHARMLVGDLTDASRIARGGIRLQKERVSLSEVLEAALNAVGPAIDAAGQKLVTRLPRAGVRVVADLSWLSQAIALIVRSACEHTAPGGKVAVFHTLTADSALVHVQDAGPWVAEDRLPHLFGLFAQREQCRRGVPPELGFALYTARRLIELHGGNVKAANAVPTRGLLVTARLSLTPELGQGAGLRPSPESSPA